MACPGCLGTGTEPAGDEASDDGDDLAAAACDDHAGPWRGAAWGMTPAQVVALNADSLRYAVAHGAPLVDPLTGHVVDRLNCADAA